MELNITKILKCDTTI